MANALVLAPSSMISLSDVRERETLPAPARVSAPASGIVRARPRYLYGDGTPFSYDVDFIETVGRAIDCGIAVMRAQDRISRALTTAAEVERACATDRTKLQALADGMARVLGAAQATESDRVSRATEKIVSTSRKTIDSELQMLERQRETEMAAAGAKLKDARIETARALESFIAKEDLPGTDVCLRLTLHGEEYRAEAMVLTPFGVHAVFELEIPKSHEWTRARRIASLGENVVVDVPQEAGWFKKRVEVQPLTLDRLVVHGIAVTPERSVLTLRKSHGGAGYKLELSRDTPTVVFRAVAAEGTDTSSVPCDLSAEDSAKIWSLWRRILATSGDLGAKRRAMKSAYIEGTPLMEHSNPESIVRRLVETLAPIVNEISRRSCSPGELVLRRDVRAWRREEIYITKAELEDRVQALPILMRRVFDPLGLAHAVRSPRAPMPSVSARIELGELDIVAE